VKAPQKFPAASRSVSTPRRQVRSKAVETSQVTALEIAQRFEMPGCRDHLHDIARDGC